MRGISMVCCATSSAVFATMRRDVRLLDKPSERQLRGPPPFFDFLYDGRLNLGIGEVRNGRHCLRLVFQVCESPRRQSGRPSALPAS